jgi:hypothetical protein
VVRGEIILIWIAMIPTFNEITIVDASQDLIFHQFPVLTLFANYRSSQDVLRSDHKVRRINGDLLPKAAVKCLLHDLQALIHMLFLDYERIVNRQGRYP